MLGYIVYLVYFYIQQTETVMKHYKIVAKNRHGYTCVYATQKPGLVELIKLCIRVCWEFQWINLSIKAL